jgi:Na+-translocating ferredoxin:NAD+ oxidoreductase RnfC subunit
MGYVTDSLDFPITKTTGGILAIPKGHPLLSLKDECQSLQIIQAACCQCSFCTQMCPRNALGLNVAPHKAMRAVAQGIDLLENSNGIFSCCDCGICTYQACNFGLKPHHIMRKMKAGLMKAGVKPKKEVYESADPAIEMKRLPTSRLIGRLGISEYDVPAPICCDLMDAKEVKIPLKMHVGAPSVPVVKTGQKVEKGDLIADIKEGALAPGYMRAYRVR